MRFYSLLAEATAEDLFRKLDAVNASLNDKVPTANEKTSLEKAKAKLEKRLRDEFPGTTRPVANSQTRQQGSNDWAANMARGMDAYDRYEKARTGSDADKEPYKRDIERMKAQRKDLKVAAGMGNVEASNDVKILTGRINRLYRDMFPDEWAKMELARKKASDSAYARNDKKRKEKTAAADADAKKAGLSAKQAAKMYPELAKKLFKLMELSTEYYTVNSILSYMIPGGQFGPSISKLKGIVAQLTPDEVTQLHEMVSAIHDKGYVSDSNSGMTPAQKEKFLAAITPTHSGPANPESAMTFTEFKEKFEPIIAKVKYKHNKWTKGKSLFDIYGQSMSAYDKREAIEKINKLPLKDRKLLVDQLKNVNAANKIEAARVTKLIALLSPK